MKGKQAIYLRKEKMLYHDFSNLVLIKPLGSHSGTKAIFTRFLSWSCFVLVLF